MDDKGNSSGGKLAVFQIGAPFVILLGLPGNIMVFTVIYKMKKHFLAFSYFFLATMVADTVLLLFCLLPRWMESLARLRIETESRVFCRLEAWVYYSAFTASSWFLAGMLLIRALGTLQPHLVRNKRALLFVCLGIVLIVLMSSLMPLHLLLFAGDLDLSSCYLGSWMRLRISNELGTRSWGEVVMIVPVPFVIILGSNTSLVVTIRSSEKKLVHHKKHGLVHPSVASTSQHATSQHSTPHHSTPQDSMPQHSSPQHSTSQHSTPQPSPQHSTSQHHADSSNLGNNHHHHQHHGSHQVQHDHQHGGSHPHNRQTSHHAHPRHQHHHQHDCDDHHSHQTGHHTHHRNHHTDDSHSVHMISSPKSNEQQAEATPQQPEKIQGSTPNVLGRVAVGMSKVFTSKTWSVSDPSTLKLTHKARKAMSKHKILMLLVASTLVYCILVMPKWLTEVLIAAHAVSKENVSEELLEVFELMEFANAGVKFYLYCLTGAKFRKEIYRVCQDMRKCRCFKQADTPGLTMFWLSSRGRTSMSAAKVGPETSSPLASTKDPSTPTSPKSASPFASRTSSSNKTSPSSSQKKLSVVPTGMPTRALASTPDLSSSYFYAKLNGFQNRKLLPQNRSITTHPTAERNISKASSSAGGICSVSRRESCSHQVLKGQPRKPSLKEASNLRMKPARLPGLEQERRCRSSVTFSTPPVSFASKASGSDTVILEYPE